MLVLLIERFTQVRNRGIRPLLGVVETHERKKRGGCTCSRVGCALLTLLLVTNALASTMVLAGQKVSILAQQERPPLVFPFLLLSYFLFCGLLLFALHVFVLFLVFSLSAHASPEASQGTAEARGSQGRKRAKEDLFLRFFFFAQK